MWMILLLSILLAVISADQIEHYAINRRAPVYENLAEAAPADDAITDDQRSAPSPRASVEITHEFRSACLNCSLEDPRISISIRDAFEAHRSALQEFSFSITQGNHLFANGRNDSPEGLTRLTVNTDPNARDDDATLVSQRVPALIDALVGTSLQYAQAPIRLGPNQFLYQLHDERICNENLWRLYKMVPCRSFSGSMALVRPELLRSVVGKEIEIWATRESAGHLSVGTTFRLSRVRDLNETDDEISLETETCDLSDLNIVTISNEEEARSWRGESAGPQVIKWKDLVEAVSPERNFSSDKRPRMTLERNELAMGECVRCAGTLKYELKTHSKSDFGKEVEIYDLWHSFMRPTNLHEAEWVCGEKRTKLKFDIQYRPEHPRKKLLIFKAPISAHFCSLKLKFEKDMPLWSDFTNLFEGGWELPAPVYRIFSDQVVATGTASNWILFPLVDITAFFNTVTFASLGAMMLYSRSVKEAVIPITI